MDYKFYISIDWLSNIEIKIKLYMKRNSSIAILGLGVTGTSVAKYLKKNNQEFTVYDTRKNLLITDEIKKYVNQENIILGNFEINIVKNHDVFIVSPGIKLDKIFLSEIKKNKKIIKTDIDLFDEQNKKNIICITGSNGKTTVTLLLEYILKKLGKKAKAGGNVGYPALALLEKDYEYNILELSSYQLEMTNKISCKAALVTNITPDHLDRHKTFDNYIKIKNKIFYNSEYAILNYSDKNIIPQTNQKKIFFGNKSQIKDNNFSIVEFNKKNCIYYGNRKLICQDDIKLLGNHNLLNICSALAIIHALNLDINQAANIAKSFPAVEHRIEKFYRKDNINWINDSKATNVDSTISAVLSIKPEIILLLGGRAKEQNYSELNKILSEKVKNLVIFGESKKELFEKLSSVKNVTITDSLEDAIKISKEIAENLVRESNTIELNIILSPACSSFDKFTSYEERGKYFKKSVLNEYRQCYEK